MSEPLLEVRDLNVTYNSARGPVPAVRDVSLHLDAGETLGLAGESGSGKSTMTMALLRLVPVGTKVTGTVTLAGEDVLAMKPGRLRAVRWAEAAVVFQGAQHVLNPVRRVSHQIQEAIDTHEGDNKVGDLLEQVGIPAGVEEAYPHELSGGQKQRVMIAMALACDPQLLIADEPTTALDVMVQAQVLQLLADLQRDRGPGDDLHHARPVGALDGRRSIGRDVRRAAGRDRSGKGDAARRQAPVHQGTGRGFSDHR